MNAGSEKSVMSTRVDMNESQIQKIKCLNKSIDDLNSSYVPQRLQNVYNPKVNGTVKKLDVQPLGVGYPSYGFYYDKSEETKYPEGYRYTQVNRTPPASFLGFPSYGFYCNNK